MEQIELSKNWAAVPTKPMEAKNKTSNPLFFFFVFFLKEKVCGGKTEAGKS